MSRLFFQVGGLIHGAIIVIQIDKWDMTLNQDEPGIGTFDRTPNGV